MARTKKLPIKLRVYWDLDSDPPFLNAMDARDPIPFNEYANGSEVGVYEITSVKIVNKTVTLK